MKEANFIEMTAQIVMRHAENNRVNVADVPQLIRTVHATLAGLGAPEAKAEEPHRPAISIRSSVKPDSIACLECGKRQMMLKRHLRDAHDLNSDQYRAKWKLSADYPLIAPDYAARRRDLAVTNGLGKKRIATAPKKRRQLGIRTPK